MLPPGTYVRIRDQALDPQDGNPPFGIVGDPLHVGGFLVAQAGAGIGVFGLDDVQVVGSDEIPPAALADIHRRSSKQSTDL